MGDTIRAKDGVDGLVRVARGARQHHCIGLLTERAYHKARILDTPDHRGHLPLLYVEMSK